MRTLSIASCSYLDNYDLFIFIIWKRTRSNVEWCAIEDSAAFILIIWMRTLSNEAWCDLFFTVLYLNYFCQSLYLFCFYLIVLESIVASTPTFNLCYSLVRSKYSKPLILKVKQTQTGRWAGRKKTLSLVPISNSWWTSKSYIN